MVEVHYRSEPQVNPDTGAIEPFHTRAIFSSVEDAVAQSAYDVSMGLDPLGVFERKGQGKTNDDLWDGTPTGKRYEPDDWTPILTRDELHRRAKAAQEAE